jgi:hypothetical protein
MAQAPSELKFHRQAFALLGHRPLLSPARITAIERWEKRWGLRLPASLKEYYSLEVLPDGTTIRVANVLRYSGRAFRRNQEASRPRWGWASQSGAWLYLLLDGSEDPPVFVEETGDRPDARVGTFSKHIFDDCWFEKTQSLWSDPPLVAEEAHFGPGELDYLGERFDEGLPTLRDEPYRAWEGPCPFSGRPRRFESIPCEFFYFNDDIQIHIACRGHPTRGEIIPATWNVYPDDEEALFQGALILRRCATLATTLTGRTPAGIKALERIRARFA